VTDRLAATEYDRVLELLRRLAPEEWSLPTACPGWDVKAMAGHMLGMAESAGSVRENMGSSAPRAGQARSGPTR
jgi:uncharacterized protein (TIGR03083 family)